MMNNEQKQLTVDSQQLSVNRDQLADEVQQVEVRRLEPEFFATHEEDTTYWMDPDRFRFVEFFFG